jgi:2-polyprenyl-3-methyl-5-hydroxy-6-metoxy-1,4-benzoquinol methylase
LQTIQNSEITIVDVGCGNGDMLRTADYGLQHNIKFNLIGVDANNFTVKHAINLSKMYPNISIIVKIYLIFEELKYDIVLCTLTLHHFKDEEIIKIMTSFYANASIGVVVNDLQRSTLL